MEPKKRMRKVFMVYSGELEARRPPLVLSYAACLLSSFLAVGTLPSSC